MRITFLGGGTDYPAFFDKHGGSAVYATINKHVYVSTLDQPPFVEDKFRFTYRITESVSAANQLKHPVVKEALNFFGWREPINISTMADLPGNSGLGSSSAFTASLLHNLLTRRDACIRKRELAELAIKVERELLNEPGGWQDQIATVYGGLRIINFSQNKFEVSESLANTDLVEYMRKRSVLIRVSSEREGMEPARTNENSLHESTVRARLEKLRNHSFELWENLKRAKSTIETYTLLQSATQTAWKYKKNLGPQIITPTIKKYDDTFDSMGISYYKLVGAGGGGFFLVLEDEDKIKVIQKHFKSEDIIHFNLTNTGTESVQI